MGGPTPRGSDFLVHLLPPSALQLDLGGSVRCSDEGLCLYLLLLLDEDSMVIFEINISVIVGQCLYSAAQDLAGDIPVDTWDPLKSQISCQP